MPTLLAVQQRWAMMLRAEAQDRAVRARQHATQVNSARERRDVLSVHLRTPHSSAKAPSTCSFLPKADVTRSGPRPKQRVAPDQPAGSGDGRCSPESGPSV